MDRAKFTQLNRNAGSLDSLRSGVRIWHVFATTVLDYKINISAPPRDSDHVLCWLACFAQYATAMNYLQYLNNFCEVEGLSTAWYDNSILAWKKGANKLKVANGFKYTGKRMPFTWEWIKLLIKAFDQKRKARISLFLLVCWAFLFRHLSEAFQMLVGDERDTGSLPADKHFGIWVDRQNRANLRFFKRKHRPVDLSCRESTHVLETDTQSFAAFHADFRLRSGSSSTATPSSRRNQQT